MEQMFVLLALVVLAVPVLLIICLVWLSGMRRRVEDLETEVQRLRGRCRQPRAARPTSSGSPATTTRIA